MFPIQAGNTADIREATKRRENTDFVFLNTFIAVIQLTTGESERYTAYQCGTLWREDERSLDEHSVEGG